MSFEYENLENLNIQLIDGDRGKNYPKQSEFQESGYCLFLSAKNVTKSGFQFSEKVYVSEERHNLLRAGKLERYDIVLTTRGTIGNVAFYDNSVLDDVVRVNSGMLILRANTTVWNPRFLYFLFTSKIIQEQISSLTSGSAVPQLPAKDLRKFLLPKVPMGVQNYIVKVIGDLSDKLKINDQTNQTLEEMAQAIFKSWFVDFDPVKAKMNGEQPEGMDAATASLFPEKLVESELGLIPEGWESKQLKDVLELAYGKALKKTDRVAGDVPVYGSGGLTGYHNQSLVEGPGIIVGRKGTVGSVYWEPRAFYPIDTVFYVKPRAGYSLKYCHLVLQNLGLKDMNTDAAVPGLNRNNAYRLDVVTPSEAILHKFEEIMQSFQSKVDANRAQNSNLESLRDTLLPKLLSGEVEL
ncbi:TPA: restriction endonuclease subunit S [Vibrio parahaemolyticus]|nr:restriction endonuclease subunit S [Vibrio parahaemolyticus]EJS9800970.1 restriction endonuclease subunit S [Vibrio parahaemolyticus]HCH5329947.1 restriction endonuclease subunit S [Vibrio parahaemolyticus]HCM1509127.1 restriction endonuclease subunit S [Vibrio parahaemolyticus]